jgi:LuxR family maltose regulon positive regulatory protein
MLALVAAGCSVATGDGYEAQRWTSVARAAPSDADVLEVGLLVMDAAIARHGVARMGTDARRAHELLGPGSPWRTVCLFLDGVALHLGGEREEAAARLQDGAHRAAVSAPIVQALCRAQLALVSLEEGLPERATAFAERARAQVERCGLGSCPPMALVAAVCASVAAERGDAAGARTQLEQALELLARSVDPSPWYEAQCRILLAGAGLRTGLAARARELLADAEAAVARTDGAPLLHEWLAAARDELDLAPGSAAETDWSLTSAELRVLGYLPSHLSCREIADRLYVSPNTVKTHIRGIYRKLDVSSRGHAVERARGAGLVGTPG